MRKLINLQFLETTKGTICLSYMRKDEESNKEVLKKRRIKPWRACTSTSDIEYSYIIPKYLVIASFEDGSVELGGIENLKDENIRNMWFDQEEFEFRWKPENNINYPVARAIILGIVKRFHLPEKEAKRKLYREAISAGIDMGIEAEKYLLD